MELDKVLPRLAAASADGPELRRLARDVGHELPKHDSTAVRAFRSEFAKLEIGSVSFADGYRHALADVAAAFDVSLDDLQADERALQFARRPTFRPLLDALATRPMLPTELSQRLSMDAGQLSRALKDLRNAGLVEAWPIEGGDGRTRPHRLTLRGRRAATQLVEERGRDALAAIERAELADAAALPVIDWSEDDRTRFHLYLAALYVAAELLGRNQWRTEDLYFVRLLRRFPLGWTNNQIDEQVINALAPLWPGHDKVRIQLMLILFEYQTWTRRAELADAVVALAPELQPRSPLALLWSICAVTIAPESGSSRERLLSEADRLLADWPIPIALHWRGLARLLRNETEECYALWKQIADGGLSPYEGEGVVANRIRLYNRQLEITARFNLAMLPLEESFLKLLSIAELESQQAKVAVLDLVDRAVRHGDAAELRDQAKMLLRVIDDALDEAQDNAEVLTPDLIRLFRRYALRCHSLFKQIEDSIARRDSVKRIDEWTRKRMAAGIPRGSVLRQQSNHEPKQWAIIDRQFESSMS